MGWKLADANEKFGEIVTLALREGPQRVHGHDGTVVIMVEEEYLRLVGKQMTFKDYLLNATDFTGVDLERNQSPMRQVDL